MCTSGRLLCARAQVITGIPSENLLAEEKKWEDRKERMAQMEAVLMSAINHPNIVKTFKAGAACCRRRVHCWSRCKLGGLPSARGRERVCAGGGA